MSDNIDFAELDKAIGEAMSNESAKSTEPTPKSTTKTKTKTKKRVKPRGHYLDIVDPKSDMRPVNAHPATNQQVKVSETIVAAVETSATIQDVVRPQPTRRNQSKNAKPQDTTPDILVPDDTMLPTEEYDPHLSLSPRTLDNFDNSDSNSIFLPEDDNALQLEPNSNSDNYVDDELVSELDDIERAIQEVEDQAEENDFVEAPTALDETVIDKTTFSVAPNSEEIEDDTPNANNYALGGRSPFMLADAKVDKRPLGSKLPPHHAEAIKSSKNVYSARTPVKKTADEQRIKPLVVAPPKKKSGWLRVLAILLIIIGGAALGVLCYFLYPAFFPN